MSKMKKISVLIIAHNEERIIARAIRSVEFADEVILVDNGSIDNTVEIARNLGAKVINLNANKGYSEAKKIGLSHCEGEWVLWLDSDEQISAELAREIIDAVNNPKEFTAFKLPRKSFFIRKWIRHCGWYPDYVLRLFKLEGSEFSDDLVHESVRIKGKSGILKSHILHYTAPSLRVFLKKQIRYAFLAGEQINRRKKKASMFQIVIHTFWAFVKMYIIRFGFLDGIEGFTISSINAFYVLIKYAHAFYLQRKAIPDGG